MKEKIFDNLKTIFYALIIALIIRTFFFQPFYIPSSSMEPNLLVGDRLFVSKYSYGYSKHSFPFSPNFTNKRYLKKMPERGDIIVFKTPADNRTDYIKRLIGIPGDKIQFIDGEIYLNNEKIFRENIEVDNVINCGEDILEVRSFKETLKNGNSYVAVYKKNGTILNTDAFLVPEKHLFFMGDNRDCSKDSRFLSSVGYVHMNNLVGKARIIFFSNDKKVGNFFKFWLWHKSFRFNRFFKEIK
tara:strand:+ start:4359 stop:5087 length:729 start_codon:yes stop_codon:yes gene_type:complete